MKTHFDGGEPAKAELLKLASQLYVKLRRHPGRVIDAVYMVQNEQYAREILILALQQNDLEINELASRIQGLLSGQPHAIPVLKAPVSTPVVHQPTQLAALAQHNDEPLYSGHVHDIAAHSTEEAAQHYVGALR